MIDSGQLAIKGKNARYAGYDRIIGLICGLLIALVALHVNLHPTGAEHSVALGVSCLVLFCYRAAIFLFRNNEVKRALDLFLLLFFIVSVCWFTGKTASPFIPVIYLILMASSLSLGTRITYLMAAVSILSYVVLAFGATPILDTPFAERIVELFPFVLTAHLGALLSGEAETMHAEVEKLSLTDDLTDLHNMRSFHNLAMQQEKLSKRYQRPFAICMIDADNLKQVNDKHGHLAGTELIKWTGRIISENIRECDIAARFGGDEFIIMYEGHGKEQIRPAVERIVRAMAASPFTFEGQLVSSTLSAGIASYPEDGVDLRSVMMRADEAVYRSKRLGKNRVSLFNVESRRKMRMSQVGGEQLGRAVPDLHRKTTTVNLGEGDLPGNGDSGGAPVLQDSGKS